MLTPWSILMTTFWMIHELFQTLKKIMKGDLVNMPFIPRDEPRHSVMWVYAQLAALQVPSTNSYRGCGVQTGHSLILSLPWRSLTEKHSISFLSTLINLLLCADYVLLCFFMSSSFVTLSSFSAALRSIMIYPSVMTGPWIMQRHEMPWNAMQRHAALLQVNDL